MTSFLLEVLLSRSLLPLAEAEMQSQSSRTELRSVHLHVIRSFSCDHAHSGMILQQRKMRKEKRPGLREANRTAEGNTLLRHERLPLERNSCKIIESRHVRATMRADSAPLRQPG